MSSKTLKITVNGKEFEVQVGDLNTNPVQVMVNGASYEVTVEGAPIAPAAAPAPAARPMPSPMPAPAPMPAARPAPAPAGATANAIRSPMPGTILDVVVKPGDTVKVGQQLCALEAMKMKSAIRSPRDAKIASVHVISGQKVQYNDVLVTFE